MRLTKSEIQPKSDAPKGLPLPAFPRIYNKL